MMALIATFAVLAACGGGKGGSGGEGGGFKVGYTADGKPVAALSSTQRTQFAATMEDVGRVNAASSAIANPVGLMAMGNGFLSIPPGASNQEKLNRMVQKMKAGGCRVEASPSRVPTSFENFNMYMRTVGAGCPVAADMSLSGSLNQNPGGRSATFALKMVSQYDITDSELIAMNDVKHVSLQGAGQGVINATTNGSAAADLGFSGGGVITSVSRGEIRTTSELHLAIQMTRNTQAMQMTASQTFSFTDFTVLIQIVGNVAPKGETSISYYLNGQPISATELQNLIGKWEALNPTPHGFNLQ